MIYAGYFIVIFTLFQWLIAVSNFLFGKFRYKTSGQLQKKISVLIPARNEEATISNILSDLAHQYSEVYEIIVYDDLSDDNTAEVVRQLAGSNKKIRLLSSDGLPAGWHGKNYACHVLSENASGDYLLFVDADVRMGKDLIRNTVTFAGKHNLRLLSIFPKQVLLTKGEWATVPVMNYILLSLLPLALVAKSKFSSLSAANGQFMLFEADTYRKYQPHKKFSLSRFEDIEIARFYKREHQKIACMSGNSSINCRMYTNYTDAVNGFSRNVIGFFGGSFLLAIVFWLITTVGFLVVLYTVPGTIVFGYFFLLVSTRIIVSWTSEQNSCKNLLYLLPQQFSLGLFIYRAIINRIKKHHEWKGRNIL